MVLQGVAPWLVGSVISENYRPAIPYIMPAGFFLTAMITGTFYHALLLAGKREAACLPVDLSFFGLMALGSMAAVAWGGDSGLRIWLLATPLLPWALNRPLARSYYFRPDGAGTSAPDR